MTVVPEAVGYAIISFGKIDVTTISPTERGALVNWLVTFARIPIFAWTTDDQIFKKWREQRGRDHHVMPVSIIACTMPPADRAGENG